jgi:hypothetical protein
MGDEGRSFIRLAPIRICMLCIDRRKASGKGILIETEGRRQHQNYHMKDRDRQTLDYRSYSIVFV